MPQPPWSLNVTLTWMQTIVAIVTIGGSIVFACVKIELATREIMAVSAKLTAHDGEHVALDRDRAETRLEFERRVTRTEERLGIQ